MTDIQMQFFANISLKPTENKSNIS